MKKTFTLFLALICCAMVSADVYKYRATKYAYREENAFGKWSDWSEWQYFDDSGILVVIDGKKRRISFYGRETLVYDIISTSDKKSDGSRGDIFDFECVDYDGVKCHLRHRFMSNGQQQIYVDYSNCSLVYSLESK